MSAPGPVLQVCALVSYPHGLATPAEAPIIAVFGRVDPADESDPGILMRVERCTGAGCSGFASRGTSGVFYIGSGAPQTEFLDSGAYATVYNYRVRMENADGVSAWSPTISIDTTIQGTASCDSGALTDMTQQLQVFAAMAWVEYLLYQVDVAAGMAILEYYASDADKPDGGGGDDGGPGGGGGDPGPGGDGGGLIGEVDICSQLE